MRGRVDPVLQSLVRYQELSLELTRLNARLEQFPLRIAEIDQELEKAAGSVQAARDAVADHQKDRRKLESELQDLEAKLSKYNGQLMQVKTNEEYKAMQHEIEGVKEKVGDVEEKILLLMEKTEASEGRIREEQLALEGRRKEAEEAKRAVGEERRQVEQEAARVAGEQQAARGTIGADVVDLFDRIAGSRNGVAVARASDERCQECNVRIRPQIFQEIRRNDRLIQCDTCRRILYYIPEPPGPDAPPADAPPPADTPA